MNTSICRQPSQVDTIIQVDHSLDLVYPEWLTGALHPELDKIGPPEYDLAKIELYFHDRQFSPRGITGKEIHDHLVRGDMIKYCLGLRDGYEILKKGPVMFRQLFGSACLLLWRSAALESSESHRNLFSECDHEHPGLYVPYVTIFPSHCDWDEDEAMVIEESLVIHWICVTCSYSLAVDFPSARFPS